ncbi:heme-degrading domain-containing protein [Agreia sp. VKM Ac-1783]|uniref:heme-degrading domain-containing protein n=1 Tax=Agreia sp. VKM Ac-1783 TaxID=1938889 RepID=UPI000A3C11D3|nr:heme-degrading domain-containing protein [Agreia sp. VKM Ac-1783]
MTAREPATPEEFAALAARIEDEITQLQVDAFGPADALRLGLILVRRGTEGALPIAIDIRRGEHILFHAALEGAQADNDVWIARKARSVERYGIPSLLLGTRPKIAGKRIENEGWFDQMSYAAHGGGFPVSVKGVGMVAVVTVSGLPQIDDHDLVVAALREFVEGGGTLSA